MTKFQSHIRRVRDGLERGRQKAEGRPARVPGIRISRAGRSSFHPLVFGSQTVGGGADCDLIVLGIEPKPLFAVTLQEGRGGVMVEAFCDGLSIADRPLKDGEEFPFSPGMPLRFADTEFHIEGLESASPAGLIASRHAMAAGLFALAALSLLFSLQIDNGNVSQAASVRPLEQTHMLSAEAAVAELQEAIRLARLTVEVPVVLENGEIRVGENASSLVLADRRRLDSIIGAIGRRAPVPVVNMTSLASGLSGFVAAAGYEPFRFIIGKDGRRYREGEELSSGWHLKEIRPGRVIVARGDDIDTVTFGEGTDPASDVTENRAS